MKKDFYEIHNAKLLSRARVLMRSFWVNTALVLLVCGISFIPGFLYFGALITGVPGAWFYYLMICGLALWELIGVIFFLVPSIATFWEHRTSK